MGCDTGFGPGQLTCYYQGCRVNGGLTCGIWSKRKTGSGSTTVNAPAGYTATGGGIYNHYRTFNEKSGFENSYPVGNGWKGDMGFGWGDYTVYVRGCKVNAMGHSLSCTHAVTAVATAGPPPALVATRSQAVVSSTTTTISTQRLALNRRTLTVMAACVTPALALVTCNAMLAAAR